MSVEIHVACRRDPSSVARVFQSCRVAHVQVLPARTVRAWSPRAHATLLIRERDVAGVVTFRCDQMELATQYAELVARTFEGVAVVDGEVVEPVEQHAIAPADFASAWNSLDGRTHRVLEERQADKLKRRVAYERMASQSEGDERDFSSH